MPQQLALPASRRQETHGNRHPQRTLGAAVVAVRAQQPKSRSSSRPNLSKVARQRRLPRSKLWRAWDRRERMGGTPTLRDAFDSPEGQAFLHALVVVLLLVIVVWCGAGVERVRFALQALKLERRVACSRSHLQQRASLLRRHVREFGREETARLAVKMPERTVNVCPDELFLGKSMVLVANDPLSGWSWVQTLSPTRDAEAWTEAFRKGTKGQKLRVRMVTADCAKGLLGMALWGLGVSHCGELFHGVYELSKGYSRRLVLRVTSAEAAHHEAVQRTRTLRAERRKCERGKRGPGRPRAWEHHVAVAEAEQKKTAAALAEAQRDRETMGEVVRGLGQVVHPVNLETGESQDGPTTERLVGNLLARARHVVQKLGEGHAKALNKVWALVPGWASLVQIWWADVRQRIAAEGLPPGLSALLLTALLPALYLESVSRRNHNKSEARKKLLAVRDRLLATVRANPLWQALPKARRAHLLVLCKECVGWFARCTGSTEGGNGWLRLHYSQHHAVDPEWLESLQVLRNFMLRREDGSTAAQRYFGQPHRNLVTALLARMPPSPLPRHRMGSVESDLKRLEL